MTFNLVETLEEALYESGVLILCKYSHVINKRDSTLISGKTREVLDVHEMFRYAPPLENYSIIEQALLAEAKTQELDITEALGYISELYDYAKELKKTNVPENVTGTAMFNLVGNFLTGRYETKHIPNEQKMKLYRRVWTEVIRYLKETPHSEPHFLDELHLLTE
jgi:hypothetical protein